MTSIDPEVLEREVKQVADALVDSDEFRRRTLDLLRRYEDRTRRPGASTRAQDTPWSFHTPRPVLRSLRRALRAAARLSHARAERGAEVLWGTGYREARLLATELLGSLTPAGAADRIEAWGRETSDPMALAALAGVGLARWRRVDPGAFLARVSLWLASREARLRALALSALQGAVLDPEFEDLPALFRMLEGAVERVRGEERRSLYALVRELARRTAPETAGFLLSEVNHPRPGAIRLARAVLAALPGQQQERLKEAIEARHRQEPPGRGADEVEPGQGDA